MITLAGWKPQSSLPFDATSDASVRARKFYLHLPLGTLLSSIFETRSGRQHSITHLLRDRRSADGFNSSLQRAESCPWASPTTEPVAWCCQRV